MLMHTRRSWYGKRWEAKVIETERWNGSSDQKRSVVKGYGWSGRADGKRRLSPNWRKLPNQLKQGHVPFATGRFRGASLSTKPGWTQLR